MSRFFHPHREILPPAQQRLWPLLQPAAGLAAAGKMYGSAFQPSESLKALVYFEGGDLNTLTTEEKNQLVKAVSEVRDLPRDVEIVSRQLAVPMPEDRFPAGSEGTKCSTN